MGRQTEKTLFYKHKLSLEKRIGITTGNPDGIGKIVVERSLEKLGPQKHFQFIVWTDKKAKALKVKKFKVRVFANIKEALASPFHFCEILEIKTSRLAGDWVEEASLLCLKNKLSALITGPISKHLMKKSKQGALSHTELLKNLSKTKDVFMSFLGEHFNLILLTDHIPFSQIRINKTRLETLIVKALKFRKILKPSLQNKPLGLLGLNPHAGEDGLLGLEEEKILKPLILKFNKEVEGPLVPDSAFLKKNWSRYSFYISLYHDQGLPTFKTIHNHKGVSVSLGLPFIRTGVDHGTGIDLKSSEIKSDSFFLALKKALLLTKRF